MNLVLLFLLASLSLAACGAFSDVIGEDGGNGGGGTRLIFEPERLIYQGQTKEYQISFEEPPSWENEQEGDKYLTRFEFVDADNESNELQDIQFLADYDGKRTIEATLQAQLLADTAKVRRLYIDVAWEKAGQRQQTYSGSGLFYVMPRPGLDGGSGGGD